MASKKYRLETREDFLMGLRVIRELDDYQEAASRASAALDRVRSILKSAGVCSDFSSVNVDLKSGEIIYEAKAEEEKEEA